jgi:hypothetical protein
MRYFYQFFCFFYFETYSIFRFLFKVERINVRMKPRIISASIEPKTIYGTVPFLPFAGEKNCLLFAVICLQTKQMNRKFALCHRATDTDILQRK